MGEIFERTVPDVSLAWTGERLTNSAGPQVEIEHLHRYFVARTLCRGLDVLDIACGEGYGSAFLAQTARSVVGVDVDQATVAHASAAYAAPNLRFLEGDARRIPLPDASVDAVVSFETIEHLYEHDIFLAEVRRVLRPGGRFVVSSPERDVYSPADTAANPHHVRELTRVELLALLSGAFAHVALQGQRPILGSALVTESPARLARNAMLTFERRGADRFEASEGLSRPVYLLAIASDLPIQEVPDSLYIDSSAIEIALGALPAARAEAQRAADALAEAVECARNLEAQLKARDLEFEKARQARDSALAEAAAYARDLEVQIKARDLEFEKASQARDAALAEAAAYALDLEAQLKARVLEFENASQARDAALAEAATYARDLEAQIKARDLEFEKATQARDAALAEAAGYARDLEAQIKARDLEFENAAQARDSALAEAAASARDLEAQIKARELEFENASSALAEAAGYARDLEAQIKARDLELAAAAQAGELALTEIHVRLQASEAALRALDLELAEKAVLAEAALEARDLKMAEVARVTEALRAEGHAATVRLAEVDHMRRKAEAELASVAAYARHVETEFELAAIALRDGTAYVRRVEGEWARAASERDAILHSTAWQLTWPLRRLFTYFPRTRVALRRAAKLAWWTVTLQLPRRVADRLRAPKADQQPMPGPGGPPAGDQAVPSRSPVPDDDKTLFTIRARRQLLDFLASDERLAAPLNGDPDISVVVVLWNQAHMTLRCLRALLAQQGPSIEIVLVDNASSDETEALLARLDGVRILRSASNDGFLVGCNRGAAASRGRALLLLNSDAFPRDGALAAALATLDSAPDIGAVGGRLILPSGRLQEAGSIVWSDGSPLGYGRGLEETAGEAMFRRDVDYCSGAFLMTHRTVWNRLGGFDERYAPAYFEEVDYCMRLRELGLRIVYEPRAAVVHFEYGSQGSPTEAHQLMQRNQPIFRESHAAALASRHLPNDPDNILAARSAVSAQRRVLVIDDNIPLPEFGSGYPRTQRLLNEAAALGWLVTFYPLHIFDVDWTQAYGMLDPRIEICARRALPKLRSFLEERRGFYDVVVVSRPHNMRHLRALLREQPDLLAGTRLVYDAEALYAARDMLLRAVQGQPLSEDEARTLFNEEISLTEGVHSVLTVGTNEAALFLARQSAPVHILSHFVPLSPSKGTFAERRGFLFVGRLLERDSPNYDSVSWFVREIWPLVRKELGEVTLTVIGLLHSVHPELEGPGVQLLGKVERLEPYYNHARVFVAPTRFAAGIPLKVIESSTAGLPVVGTSLIATQLGWVDGEELMVGEDAASFAKACCRLHEDKKLWRSVRAAALSRTKAEYSAARFQAVLRECLGSETQGAPTISGELHRHRRARAPLSLSS